MNLDLTKSSNLLLIIIDKPTRKDYIVNLRFTNDPSNTIRWSSLKIPQEVTFHNLLYPTIPKCNPTYSNITYHYKTRTLCKIIQDNQSELTIHWHYKIQTTYNNRSDICQKKEKKRAISGINPPSTPYSPPPLYASKRAITSYSKAQPRYSTLAIQIFLHRQNIMVTQNRHFSIRIGTIAIFAGNKNANAK